MLKRTLILMHFVALAECLYAQTDQHFWANGKLKYERTCIADSCIAKEYYETGTIKAIHKDSARLKASNGYLLGVSYYTSQYCENGQLIMGYDLNSITPVFVTKHYCDGKIEKEFW